MSKKATRRAARQAFPKAKTPPPSRSSYGSRPRSAAAARSSARPTARPPRVRRALIWAFVMAVIYFLLIRYTSLGGQTSTEGGLIVAAIGFVVFAGVVYAVDWFKFRRYQNKQKGSSR